MSLLLKVLEFFSPSTLSDEEKEVLEGYGKLGEVESYEYSFEDGVDDKDLEENIKILRKFVNRQENIDNEEFFKILLTAFSDKKSGEVVFNADKKDIHAFLDHINGLNLDCAFSMVEGSDSNYFANIIFSTKLKENTVEQLENIEDVDYYHMRAGKFFGYPENSIKAFIKQNIKNKELGGNLIPVKKKPLVVPVENIDLEDEPIDDDLLTKLIYFLVENNEEGFNNALSIAKSRKNDLEDVEDRFNLSII